MTAFKIYMLLVIFFLVNWRFVINNAIGLKQQFRFLSLNKQHINNAYQKPYAITN